MRITRSSCPPIFSRLRRGGSRALRRKVERAVCLGLMVTLLSVSTPAAPQVLTGLAAELRVSALFWLHSGALATSFKDLVTGRSGRTATAKQETADERKAQVAGIRVFPGDVTIRVGQKVTFSAIAYDAENNTVGGIRFKWSGIDAESNRRVHVNERGDFSPRLPGTFQVKAETGGQQAQVTVTVLEGEVRRRNDKPSGTREVSTRDVPAAPSSQAKKAGGETHASHGRLSGRQKMTGASLRSASAAPAAAVIQDSYWDNGNYTSADEPGNQVGDTPGAPADGGAGNGNFQIAAPVLSLPGRGIDLSLGLAYNSRLWNKSGSEMSFDIDRSWPAPGWSLGFGKVLGMGVNHGSMLVDADGTRHSFSGTVTFGPNQNYTDFVGHTTDGTFIDYKHHTGLGGAITHAEARLANGTFIEYDAQGTGAMYPTRITDPNGNYITITYRNNTGPQIQTVTDTLCRTITFDYDANNLLTAISAPGLTTGTTRTLVRLHYKTLALDYGFSGMTVRTGTTTPWVLDAIYYPATGTGYWFGDSDSYSSYGMIAKVVEQRGMGFSGAPLTEQGTVTQGTATRTSTYNYTLTPDYTLTDAPTYTTRTDTWDGMNTTAAVTGYLAQQNATPRRVEMTLPNGTKSVQLSYNAPNQFNDGLVYQDETYDSTSRLLSKSTAAWEPGAYASPRPTRTEVTDELGQTTATEFGYHAVYNRVREVRDYDYGGTSLLRKTLTEYETSTGYTNRHILSLPTVIEVYASDGTTRVSRTEYGYDGQTLTDTPEVVHHNDAFNPFAPQTFVPGSCQPPPDCPWWEICPPECSQDTYTSEYDGATDYRGNLTNLKTYADAAGLNGAITESRRYDITGNMVTASTSCCEQTSLTYTAETQYAYPTTKKRGAASNTSQQVATSATYSFNTGLVLTATDANGRLTQTDYYSNTLRPQQVTLASGAYTSYAYDDAAMTMTDTTYLAGGGIIASHSVKRLNGLGQIRQEESLTREAGVDKWDVVEAQYDIMGQLWKQSRPYRQGVGTPQWTESAYDALGRVTRVVAPDGSESNFFYNETERPATATSAATGPGETTRAVDAWGRERWGRTNSRRQLVEVIEPDPTGNGLVMGGGASTGSLVTTYSYDTLGHLTLAEQGAQQRRFSYDSLGRLTRQRLAEAGATLNDAGAYVGAGGLWSDVFAYDDRSNMIWRIDTRGVKAVFSYKDAAGHDDPLNRLQSVSYDAAGFGDTAYPVAGAPTTTYTYMTTGDVTRVDLVTTAGVSTEDFDYDAEGRVSAKTMTLASRASFPQVTEYAYDTLDRATDVRYPARYGMIGAPRKLVHHDYDVASRLSGLQVDGAVYASQIAYNPASQTTSLVVGAQGPNQLTESYDYDAQTGLLTNQKVQRGTSTLTTLLDLSYDYLRAGTTSGRTGQLARITNNLDSTHRKDRGYEYDALGRLRKATGGDALSPQWTQTYGYDRYGNRQSVVGTSTPSTANVAAPTELVISPPSSANQLRLDWTPSAGAHHYQIERRGKNEQFQVIGTSETPTYTDTGITSGKAYLYRVRAVDANNQVSASTNIHLGTAVGFDALVSGVTIIQAAHMQQLRDGVNAVRELANLPLVTAWVGTSLTGMTVQAAHMTEVREKLAEALSALGLPNVSYSEQMTAQVTVIRKTQFEEVRQGINRRGGSESAAQAPGGAAIPRDGHASLAYDAATNRISTPGWEYDAAGNQTRVQLAGGAWQRYRYDAAGRLVTVLADDNLTVLASYTYGAGNARLLTEEGGLRTYYAWSGGAVISEYNESGGQTSPQWTKSYIYLGGRLLSTLTPSGGGEYVQYQHPDRLGTRLVTNSSDTNSFEQLSLPYGTALEAESSGATARRFTTYDRSAVTGLDYAVNRHYDSQQGRFTQVDPIGMQAASLGDPQSMNLYAYCGNDPINRTDPEGLFWGKLFRGVAKVVGFVLKVAAAAAAVFVAFVSIVSGHPEGLIVAGLLFAYAFGGATVQRILGAAGGATSIYQQRPGIIWNLVGGSAGSGAAGLEPWAAMLGTIASFLQTSTVGERGLLTGARKEQYEREKAKAKQLSKSCRAFLRKHNISPRALINAIDHQRPFDAKTSTINAGDAGIAPRNGRAAFQAKFDISLYMASAYAIRAKWWKSGVGATGNDVYFGEHEITAGTIFHEALHSLTNLDDIDLAAKLGQDVLDALLSSGRTMVITEALQREGCP